MIVRRRIHEHCESLSFTREECIKIVEDILIHYQTLPADQKQFFRLLATPILYSSWERIFRHGIALCFLVLRDLGFKAKDYSPQIRARWLTMSNFYKSYIDTIRGIIEIHDEKTNDLLEKANRRTKRGVFTSTANSLEKIDEWESESLSLKIDISDLVLTFSNVNGNVLRLNAEIIGIDKYDDFDSLNTSKLDELVNIRNDIGHGGSVTPPGERGFIELVEYTRKLVNDFSELIESFIIKESNKSPAGIRNKIRQIRNTKINSQR